MFTIHLIGDSTVAACPPHESPMAGWGQVLANLIEHRLGVQLTVKNHAKSGASSNSYIEEGLFDKAFHEVMEGDVVLIQFGHNDQKDYGTKTAQVYTDTLTRYLNQAYQCKARAILVTPVHRRFFKETGEVRNTLDDFPGAVRQLSQDYGCPCIDLSKITERLYSLFGIEGSKRLFVHFDKGDNDNYPNGVADNTHFSYEGAKCVANAVVQKLLDFSYFEYLEA